VLLPVVPVMTSLPLAPLLALGLGCAIAACVAACGCGLARCWQRKGDTNTYLDLEEDGMVPARSAAAIAAEAAARVMHSVRQDLTQRAAAVATTSAPPPSALTVGDSQTVIQAATQLRVEALENAQHAEQAANLVSALTEALDRLWDRPHDTRVATLRLLDCLSDLDDRSLCMLCGSIVQYVEARSESVE
jgi:hypothetical protein